MARTWTWMTVTLSLAVPLQAQMRPDHGMMGGMMGRIAGLCRTDKGDPVEGVRIRVVDQAGDVVSTAEGRFTLGPLAPGRYIVETRRIGFRPVRRVVEFAARDTVIELRLTPAPITVDELVIEAIAEENRRTHELADVLRVPPVGTANVSTVTSAEIETVHAHDPWDLMRQTTGLEVHHQGQGPGFASNAVIRGFTSDHSADVALVIDGVPVNEPVNGHNEGFADWNLLLPEAVADVQVIKGPISPLFGNFANGGAVNVTTKASAERATVRLEGGSYGYTAGAVAAGFEKGPWGGFVAAQGARTGGWRENSNYRIGQVLARANRRVSSTLVLDAGAQVYATSWNSPGYLSLPDFDRGLYTMTADPTDGGTKWRAMGRVAAQLTTERVSWQTGLWAYQSRWRLFLNIPALGSEMEGLGAQSEDRDIREAAGLRSLARWTRGAWDLTLGLEGQRQHTTYGLYQTTRRVRDLTVTRLDGTFQSAGTFGGAAATIGRTVRLEGTLRADVLGTRTVDRLTQNTLPRETHVVLSPKFGAVFYARSDWHLYGSAARGFRTAPGFIRDPALHPVSVWAFELGSRYARKAVDASAGLFRIESTHERLYNPITLRIESDGRSVREGIEVELALRPARFVELQTHWTFNTRGKFFLPEAPAGAMAEAMLLSRNGLTAAGGAQETFHDDGMGDRVPGVADYVGRAGLTLRPLSKLEVNAWITFTGSYVPLGEPEAKVQPHNLTNLQVRIPLRSASEIALGVDNLLNTRGPELRASGFVTPCQARTLHLSVVTQF